MKHIEELLDGVLAVSKSSETYHHISKTSENKRCVEQLLALPTEEQPEACMAICARYGTKTKLFGIPIGNKKPNNTQDTRLRSVLCSLLKRKQAFTEEQLLTLGEMLGNLWYFHGDSPQIYFGPTLKRYINANGPPSLEVKALAEKLIVKWSGKSKDEAKWAKKVSEVIVDEHSDFITIPIHKNGEVFAEAILDFLNGMKESELRSWGKMLSHAADSEPGSPTKKWMKLGREIIDDIGEDTLKHKLMEWLPLINKPSVNNDQRAINYSHGYTHTPDPMTYIDAHLAALKGFAWYCGLINDDALTRIIGAAGVSAYQKVPGVGPRATRLGNAAVWALGNIGSDAALAQLALMKVKVKFGTAQKSIEKALGKLAEKLGVQPEELEEMSVPEYGLTEVGRLEEKLGDYTAVLEVVERKPKLTFLKPDGNRMKSVPAAVKTNFAEDLKELKGSAKDLEKMLSAQRERLDNLFLLQKSWPIGLWKERYLNHPVVGIFARKLIWSFSDGETVKSGIWLEDQIVSVEAQPLELNGDTVVKPWHPIEAATEEVLAWRRFLFEHLIKQPFKQAHREVYLLTDAERNTDSYSNRFASHILKQHQFNSLCANRGWKNKLRLMVDDEYPPAFKSLPQWGLRAEFWIEGVGDDYTEEYVLDSGSYRYVSTDQLRFYEFGTGQLMAHAGGGGYTGGRMGAPPEPVRMENIPPIVFSEIMRDVDLFVGVSSVGNDPNWNDGGLGGHYQDYWYSHSFGDLGETAEMRKKILAGLLPRLKIADVCKLEGKFLWVKGKVRTYKIHLGSGNILMEPNDQYLCIVKAPSRSKDSDKLFLPFEGDDKMSMILSKAFLLATDDKIKDEAILSQIRLR